MKIEQVKHLKLDIDKFGLNLSGRLLTFILEEAHLSQDP